MTQPVTSLVSLTDAFTHLQIQNPTDTQQSQMQGFLDAATAMIQFETGPVVGQTFTEVHSGGGPTIVLLNPPVFSVASVTEYVGPTAYSLTQCELGSSTGAYAFSVDDAAAGVICRRYNGGLAGSFAGGLRNIQVVYTAGLAAVPGDIRMAVLEDLRGLFQQSQQGGTPGWGDSGEAEGSDAWTVGPMHLFPRLAAVLAGPTRTPSIA